MSLDLCNDGIKSNIKGNVNINLHINKSTVTLHLPCAITFATGFHWQKGTPYIVYVAVVLVVTMIVAITAVVVFVCCLGVLLVFIARVLVLGSEPIGLFGPTGVSQPSSIK